jgi:hypothetical protein
MLCIADASIGIIGVCDRFGGALLHGAVVEGKRGSDT